MKITVTFDTLENTISINYPHLEIDEGFAIRNMHAALEGLEAAIVHEVGKYHMRLDTTEGMTTIHTVHIDEFRQKQQEYGTPSPDNIIDLQEAMKHQPPTEG